MTFFHHFPTRVIGLLVAILLSSGCLSHPRLVTVIYEGDDGTVFLKEFQDSAPRANHPVILESQLVRRILMGVRIHERKTMIESTLTGDAEATPAFTFAEANFLAPLLVSAFQQATPQEAVHFKINGEESGKQFDTRGLMFIKEKELNFSLTEYGLTPQRPGTLSQPSQSFDRPKRWSVTFTPISAVLNAEEDKKVVQDEEIPKPIWISLEVLRQYPASLPEEKFNSSPSDMPPTEGKTHEEMGQEIEQIRKSMKVQEERLQRLERQTGE